MSPKQKEQMERQQIQQLQNELRNMKKLCHSVSGEAVGMISDTLTDILNQLGTKLLGLTQTMNIKDAQIAQHKAQIAELQTKLKKLEPEPEPKEEPPVKP